MELETVRYLAELGKISFNDEELKKMAEDMTGIIEIMDTIKEFDLDFEPHKDDCGVYLNDLREDMPAASYPAEKILMNALRSENAFVVPKVVE